MGSRLHKRLSVEFVQEVLEAFNEKRITEKIACELFGLKRARLYKLRRDWLRCQLKGKEFRIWNRDKEQFSSFSRRYRGVAA